jgi:hypothetical protein
MKNAKMKQLLAASLVLLLSISGCASQNGQEETTEQKTMQNSPVVAAILDSVQQQEDALQLSIDLYCANASFTDDFSVDDISYDQDLKAARTSSVEEISEDGSQAKLCLVVPFPDLKPDELDLESKITLASGALQDESGSSIEQEVEAKTILIYSGEDESRMQKDAAGLLYDEENNAIYYLVPENASYSNILEAFRQMTLYAYGCKEIASGQIDYVQRFVFDFSNTTSTEPQAMECILRLIRILKQESQEEGFMLEKGIMLFNFDALAIAANAKKNLSSEDYSLLIQDIKSLTEGANFVANSNKKALDTSKSIWKQVQSASSVDVLSAFSTN